MKYTEDEYLALLKAYKSYLAAKGAIPTIDESKLLAKLTFYEIIRGKYLDILQISIRKHFSFSQVDESLKSYVLRILDRNILKV